MVHLWIREPQNCIAKGHDDRYGGTVGGLVFTVVEAGSPGSRCWPICFLLKSLSFACRSPFLCMHTSLVSLPLLIRTPVLLDKSPTLVTSLTCYLRRALKDSPIRA